MNNSNEKYLSFGNNPGLRVLVCDTYEMASAKAASVIAGQIVAKPDTILGLATGSSPVGIYKELQRLCKEGILDFSKVRTYNLDEYYPLEPENDQSYRYFMNKNLFSGINIPMENTHVPSGTCEDPEKHGLEYDAEIAALGGIDLQVLGIGHNGHIGFNEPDTAFTMPTHVVTLTEDTIDANSRFFASADLVPKKAISMGIATIFAAKSIVLIANGKNKAEVLKKALTGPVDPQVPASILQLHPNVLFVLDAEAASELL